jgi:hypothetical protein
MAESRKQESSRAALRGIALTRKDRFIFGLPGWRRTGGHPYTILQTADGLDPEAYFADLMDRLAEAIPPIA